MTTIAVLDIESEQLVQNWDKPWEAGVSVCCVQTSWRAAPVVYTESNLDKLPGLLHAADMVVTYNGAGYDLPVLAHLVGDLRITEHVDLMLPLHAALGWRPRLEHVARGTLRCGKSGHGSNAPDMYQQGNWGGLISYCLQDVAITYQLYEFATKHGYLVVWDDKNKTNRVVELSPVGRRPAKGRTPGFWHQAARGSRS